MKLKTKPNTGQDLLAEFEAVIDDIAFRANERRDDVRARLAELEAESAVIADLLNQMGE